MSSTELNLYTGIAGATAYQSGYRQVCSGSTGHAEAVQLTYQKGSVGYGELVEFFYRTHDPTTVNRQGPDRGSRESSPRRPISLLQI